MFLIVFKTKLKKLFVPLNFTTNDYKIMEIKFGTQSFKLHNYKFVMQNGFKRFKIKAPPLGPSALLMEVKQIVAIECAFMVCIARNAKTTSYNDLMRKITCILPTSNTVVNNSK